MKKRLLRSFGYLLFSCLVIAVAGVHGTSGPMKAFTSWSYLMMWVPDGGLFVFLVFYIGYVTALFLMTSYFSSRTKSRSPLLIIFIHGVGAVINAIAFREYGELWFIFMPSFLLSLVFSSFYLLLDWKLARQSQGLNTTPPFSLN